jgi:hypothetical protein
VLAIKKPKLAVHAISCQYAGYGASRPLLWDEKLACMAKVFPSMCKPDAETAEEIQPSYRFAASATTTSDADSRAGLLGWLRKSESAERIVN